MMFAIIARALLTVFGPLLIRWLDRLLSDTARQLDNEATIGHHRPAWAYSSIESAVVLLDQARARLPFYAWRRRAKLRELSDQLMSNDLVNSGLRQQFYSALDQQ